MEAEELKNYLCRRVIITLNDSQRFKGYFKKIDNGNAILNISTSYKFNTSKDIVLPIKDIIGIRIWTNFFDKFKNKKYPTKE